MREFKYSAEQILHFIRTKKDAFWSRERETRPLELFHEAAKRVPAYKDFLKKNRINPAKIKTFKDFQLVPPVSRKNYLRQYPLEKLCWDGTLAKPLVFTSTSGSTGEPFYFPRGKELDWEYSILAELFLENSSYNSGGPTLVIVGFGMGVWIGGLMTYKAFEIMSQREKYPISIITPGINKKEIFNVLRNLSPHYKETILVGYPPFVKDVIDEAVSHEGINVKKLNLRLLFAAEAFSEKFRDYLVKKIGTKNPCLDTLNIYGTADIGAMAFETPTSILIRRLALKNKKLFLDIFSKVNKTPTLAQYNPFFITFESVGGEIVLSGDNSVPLVRYALGDHGGTFDFSEIAEKLSEHKVDFEKETHHIKKAAYELPFVYVYERVDFSTTLYGLQIYPEVIREVLISKSLHKHLSGKFTMLTKFDKKHNQYLEIHLEMRKNKKPHKQLESKALKEIIVNLRVKNSEFRELHDFLKERAHPKLVFWPHEHPLHFKPGIKQKWVKK